MDGKLNLEPAFDSWVMTASQSYPPISEEQLKAFIAKIQADTSLQEQLKAEGADVIAIAKAAGFSISTEDLNTHRQNMSDGELEGVAGGKVVSDLGWFWGFGPQITACKC